MKCIFTKRVLTGTLIEPALKAWLYTWYTSASKAGNEYNHHD